ncbi:hypothetical protein [uncultured Chryseobacterium sp.]|uniref:hypothetical protein n=1 Tax=uncultured Chryseobacterium sp. TaxID=259322 RepID=UPI0025F27BA3|nr:hypothetical protein [uncultured Chryseobacterium sp.]
MNTPLNTILNWFQTGDFPTEAQFTASWSSFRHKDDAIPADQISGLSNLFQQTASIEAFNTHLADSNAHAGYLAKLDATNLNTVHRTAWRAKLGVGDIPANVALVDQNQDSAVYNKSQINALFMMVSDFVQNGKIRADKIESLGLTELITATETSLSSFITNSGNYTFEKNDFIAVPINGNYSLFIFKGGDKTVSGNYLPTGLTNITMAMVQGLQSALDSKLNTPTTTSYYAVFWNGSSFQSSDIYTNPLNGRVGIGTGAGNLEYKFEVSGPTKLSSLNLANPANAQGDAAFTKMLVINSAGVVGVQDKITQSVMKFTTGSNTGISSFFRTENPAYFSSTIGRGSVELVSHDFYNDPNIYNSDLGASGEASVAIGNMANASGQFSVAIGQYARSQGMYSLALGRTGKVGHYGVQVAAFDAIDNGAYNTIISSNSVTIGNSASRVLVLNSLRSSTNDTWMQNVAIVGGANHIAKANGVSLLGGTSNQATSHMETIMGCSATIGTGQETTYWQPTDRLFVIGNGSENGSTRSDAFHILKNGTVTLPTFTKALLKAANGRAAVTKESIELVVTTTDYSSKADLNTAYPNVLAGFEVVNKLTNTLWKKLDNTDWCKIPITLIP